jgi:hypothetical protein
MPIRKCKAKLKTSRSGTATTAIALTESRIPESLSRDQQASSCVTIDPLSQEVPSKDHPTLDSLPKDRQPADGPTTDVPAGEALKDPLAVESPSEDPPTTEDSDDDFVEVSSTKMSSNSSKRSLETADDEVDDEVDDQAESHKRLKVDKDTSLPNSQVNLPYDAKASSNKSKVQSKRKTRSKFREHSLKSYIDNESRRLDTASIGCTKLWGRSLRNTRDLSDLIKLEDKSAKLFVDMIENMALQTRKLIAQFIKVEERRRGQTLKLFRNRISESRVYKPGSAKIDIAGGYWYHCEDGSLLICKV